MKKAIVLDLDGTFLTDDYKITALNKKAVAKAIEKGWDVIISTGKSFTRSRKYYDSLKLDTWFINSHGKIISKPNESIYEFQWMNERHVKDIIEDHASKMKNFVIETRTDLYAFYPEHKDLKKYIPNAPIKQYVHSQEIKQIIGFYAVLKDGQTINTTKLRANLWEWSEGENIVYFKSKDISKWKSIQKIMKREKYEFWVAFGNGRSDIEVLKHADIGIAMCNAHEKVLEVIPRLTKEDNNNSGVGHEILKLIQETS